MNDLKPPHPLPPPLRFLVVALICSLLILAAIIFVRVLPDIRSMEATRIPGAPCVHAFYLPSDESGMTLDNVLEKDRQGFFQPLPHSGSTSLMNRRFDMERWYRLDFTNSGTASQPLVLDLIWRTYDRAELYLPGPGGSWRTQICGSTAPRRDPRLSPLKSAFALDIPAGETLQVYLKVRDNYRLPLQFQVWPNPLDFARWERVDFTLRMAYFGIWVGVVSYSLFLFAMLREPSQLYFVLFAGAFGAMQLVSQDITSFFFAWPTWPLAEILILFFAGVALMALCQFTRHFLDTIQQDLIGDRGIRFLRVLSMVNICLMPAVFWPPVALAYIHFFYALSCVVLIGLLWSALRRWRAGANQAVFFILAFVPVLLGLLYRSLFAQDILFRNDETRLVVLLTNGLCLIFLSFAAAGRHRQALEDNFALQYNYMTRLEQHVEKRTQELKILNDRLAVSVAERDRVMAIIGHDLRGPASSLHSFSSLLASEGHTFTPGELSDVALKIGHACTMQMELLNNLLMWGGTHSGNWRMHPELLSVRTAIDSSWRLLEDVARDKNLSLSNDAPGELSICADKQLVETVLRNLLANAIKFSHDGGFLHAGAALSQTNQVEIWVRDHGVGIPAGRLAVLFDGAVQSTPGTHAEKGAGIGLNLCRDLARTAGGDLRLDSQPGQGTVARFFLPSGISS